MGTFTKVTTAVSIVASLVLVLCDAANAGVRSVEKIKELNAK